MLLITEVYSHRNQACIISREY